jgi:hypothetical protein
MLRPPSLTWPIATPSPQDPCGGRPDGIFINPFEQGEIGPELFRAACKMGLEGLVSKRSDRPHRAGRSRDWIKVIEPVYIVEITTRCRR